MDRLDMCDYLNDNNYLKNNSYFHRGLGGEDFDGEDLNFRNQRRLDRGGWTLDRGGLLDRRGFLPLRARVQLRVLDTAKDLGCQQFVMLPLVFQTELKRFLTHATVIVAVLALTETGSETYV